MGVHYYPVDAISRLGHKERRELADKIADVIFANDSSRIELYSTDNEFRGGWRRQTLVGAIIDVMASRGLFHA